MNGPKCHEIHRDVLQFYSDKTDTATHSHATYPLCSRRPGNCLIKSRCSDTLPAAGLPSRRAPWQPRQSVKKRKRCLPWLITVAYARWWNPKVVNKWWSYQGEDASSNVLKQEGVGKIQRWDNEKISHWYLIQCFLHLRYKWGIMVDEVSIIRN
jgi:hypothetical protein